MLLEPSNRWWGEKLKAAFSLANHSLTDKLVGNTDLIGLLNKALELSWLLIVILVPLVFVPRGEMVSASTIAYLEVPKIAILRSLVGLIAILWLIELGVRGKISLPFETSGQNHRTRPGEWLTNLTVWLKVQPEQLIVLAVVLFLSTVILSTVLSTSFNVSLWGQVPGEDGYATYTVISYVVLFGAIATHLKTTPQLMRILAAFMFMGTLVAVYAILQHYGYDPFNLTDPPNTVRSTSTMGNPILAASTLLMTLGVTFVVLIFSLQRHVQKAVFWWLPGILTSSIVVQCLGLIFTSSRGPWAGALLALGAFFVLALVFLRWKILLKAVGALALVTLVTLAVLSVPQLTNGDGDSPQNATRIADVQAAPVDETTLDTGDSDLDSKLSHAVASVRTQLTARGNSGRLDIWRDSWRLMVNRPWFETQSLSLDFLRPVIGYGPDLFRYTYMLESTPKGGDIMPWEPAHAHNYFVHQGVELGFLGAFTSIGILIVAVLVSGYALIWKRRSISDFYKLALIGAVAIILGRGLEQLTGIARVSDLTIFWALLGVVVALPVIMVGSRRAADNNSSEAAADIVEPSALSGTSQAYRWLMFSAIALLIAAIGTVTWIKTINYPRAALAVAQSVENSENDDLQGSLVNLERAIDLAPDVWINYSRLAALFSVNGDQETLPQAPICAAESDRGAYLRCQAELVYLKYREGAAQRPLNFRIRHSHAHSALNLARLRGDRELYEQGVRLLGETSALVPTAWKLYNQLADAYLKGGEPEAALKPLAISLGITGEASPSTQAYLVRGVVYRELGQIERAIEDFGAAIRLAPFEVTGRLQQNSKAHNFRALSYLSLGQPQKAIQDFSEAIRSDPDYVEAFSNRGLIYRALGEPQLAIDDFNQAIEFDPLYPVAYLNRGLAYSDLKQIQRAIQDYDEAIRLNPNSIQAYINRGDAYVELGQPGLALKDVQSAIRLDPDRASAHALGALAHTLDGNDEGANRELEEAVALGFSRVELERKIQELRDGR